MSVVDSILDLGFEDAIIFTSPSYDDAIIGISLDGSVIYDYDKMIDYLMRTDDMTYDDAIEWLDYNVIGYYPSSMNGVPPTIIYSFENGE